MINDIKRYGYILKSKYLLVVFEISEAVSIFDHSKTSFFVSISSINKTTNTIKKHKEISDFTGYTLDTAISYIEELKLQNIEYWQ
jgi:hypothetical protein